MFVAFCPIDPAALLIFSRSGHGFKHNIRLSNCVGVIDSDYRGEILVSLHRDGTEGVLPILSPEAADKDYIYVVRPGDRIAQFMVLPVPTLELEEVNELSDTARGSSGFGSTGS